MRVMLLIILALGLWAEPAVSLELYGIDSQSNDTGERISIHLSDKVKPEVKLAEDNPPRVLVDLPPVHFKKHKISFESDYIKHTRQATNDDDATQLVFELILPVELRHVHVVRERKKGYLLVFDMLPRPRPVAGAKKEEAQFQPQRQVVVIDAGHGGQDPGTSGMGVKEKSITLRYAKALKDELETRGRYKVVLTRDDDHYLFLRDRVKLAREAKGNLFISLHADSAPNHLAHGLSVYTISEKASDKEAEALAAKENKADVIGGMDLSDTSQDVADILIDLAERETRGKSAQFAKLVTHSLAKQIHLLSNTHRYAGFAVLKAPDIPSILVEVGFLSSPQEEKQLESESYRKKVVTGIANAVDGYFSKKKK